MSLDRFLLVGLLCIVSCGSSSTGSQFGSVSEEDAAPDVGPMKTGFINVPFDAGADAASGSVADAGVMGAADAPGSDTGTTKAKGTCSSVSDCRLFSNYCGGCTCEILGKDYPDPVCNGTPVACTVDPCAGKLKGCALIEHACFIPQF